MKLDEDRLAFRDAVRTFCSREVSTPQQVSALLDPGEEEQSSALWQKLANLGWLAIGVPDEMGGSGGTYIDQVILFEEMNRAAAPVKAIGATTTVAGCYRRFGSPEQQADALPAIAAGEIMAISISEPGAGSDVAAVACRAEAVDGGYLLNGQKTWCSYAHLAGRILLLARTSTGERRHDGLTLFEVSTELPGISMRRIPTMGGSEVNDIFFTDVFVDASKVVGGVGRGFANIMGGLDGERLLAAAVALGVAQRAFDELLAYVKNREQFGQPIGTFQALRHRIADMAIELECARLITYECAETLDSHELDRVVASRMASMAKVKASEVAKYICLEAVQMMGGYGYATEYHMEENLRRAILLPIYGGTNEIQREIISSGYGLR